VALLFSDFRTRSFHIGILDGIWSENFPMVPGDYDCALSGARSFLGLVQIASAEPRAATAATTSPMGYSIVNHCLLHNKLVESEISTSLVVVAGISANYGIRLLFRLAYSQADVR
jgi:hypothetical protein